MPGCICYIDDNLFAKHYYGKFLQLVIKSPYLVTTAGLFSVLSDPWCIHSGGDFFWETEVFARPYFVVKFFHLLQ